MEKFTFKAKQIVGEFWISFKGEDGVENGLVVKKLSEGSYLIPSGIKKKVFVLEEFENIQPQNNLVQLPFIIGPTDFHSSNSMGIKTYNSFLKAFKKVFCLPKSKKE